MRIIISFLILGVALPVFANAKQPAGGPAKPDELKVLQRLVGTWKDEAVFKIAEWTKKEKKETSNYQTSSALNGWFIQQHGRSADGKTEDFQMMTFDVEKKLFRRWYFDSDGISSEATGKWDAQSATLTWTSDLGDGITAISAWRLADHDTVIWSRIAKDAAGKIYSNIEGKLTRQKR